MNTEQEANERLQHWKAIEGTYCKRCKSSRVFLVLRANDEYRLVIKCRCARMVEK